MAVSGLVEAVAVGAAASVQLYIDACVGTWSRHRRPMRCRRHVHGEGRLPGILRTLKRACSTRNARSAYHSPPRRPGRRGTRLDRVPPRVDVKKHPLLPRLRSMSSAGVLSV